MWPEKINFVSGDQAIPIINISEYWASILLIPDTVTETHKFMYLYFISLFYFICILYSLFNFFFLFFFFEKCLFLFPFFFFGLEEKGLRMQLWPPLKLQYKKVD